MTEPNESRAGSATGMIPAALIAIGALLASPGQGASAPDQRMAAADPHAHHHHHQPEASASRRSTVAYRVPDVTLVDQNAQRVALRQVLEGDGPVMLNFIYTSCTAVCPAMSATFTEVQTALAEDSARLTMVSVSIDPEQDTPQELAAYAKRFRAGPQWRFLTGTLEESIEVQQAFDAYRGDKMNHAPLTLLRASPDAPWVRYDGFARSSDLVAESRAMLGD